MPALEKEETMFAERDHDMVTCTTLMVCFTPRTMMCWYVSVMMWNVSWGNRRWPWSSR